jgi:hypothetical protein
MWMEHWKEEVGMFDRVEVNSNAISPPSPAQYQTCHFYTTNVFNKCYIGPAIAISTCSPLTVAWGDVGGRNCLLCSEWTQWSSLYFRRQYSAVCETRSMTFNCLSQILPPICFPHRKTTMLSCHFPCLLNMPTRTANAFCLSSCISPASPCSAIMIDKQAPYQYKVSTFANLVNSLRG